MAEKIWNEMKIKILSYQIIVKLKVFLNNQGIIQMLEKASHLIL